LGTQLLIITRDEITIIYFFIFSSLPLFAKDRAVCAFSVRWTRCQDRVVSTHPMVRGARAWPGHGYLAPLQIQQWLGRCQRCRSRRIAWLIQRAHHSLAAELGQGSCLPFKCAANNFQVAKDVRWPQNLVRPPPLPFTAKSADEASRTAAVR
jgi:hypothetical protein